MGKNGHKIDKLAIKNTNVARPSKIYPNWDYWFENIASVYTVQLERTFNGVNVNKIKDISALNLAN
jgi:hypothetical protein